MHSDKGNAGATQLIMGKRTLNVSALGGEMMFAPGGVTVRGKHFVGERTARRRKIMRSY